MVNPTLVEVTRGGMVESFHTGAYAIAHRERGLIASAGDIESPVFPRSAVKAFQCLAVIESGAADRFHFDDQDIALCCASHGGEPEHVAAARAILHKIGFTEAAYECGAHWPSNQAATHALVRAGETPAAVHNNCSGKHAGMLALARMLEVDPNHYTHRDHPVQQTIARTMGAICGVALEAQPCGIDGCSVPTWAVPLRQLAQGFARFTDPSNIAAQRIINAVRAHPFMVAGSKRFCTDLMTAVPRAFVKTGAEGVFCGCIPHAGIGIALKCDDGADRASEVTMAALLAGQDVWTTQERAALTRFTRVTKFNWAKQETGEVRAVSGLDFRSK